MTTVHSNYKFAVLWSDGFPTTFYFTLDEAMDAIMKAWEKGIGAKLMTRWEYLNR